MRHTTFSQSLITPFFLLTFLPPFLLLFLILWTQPQRKDIQFGVLGIICSICAPSSLSLSGYFKLQSEGISNPDQIVFGVWASLSSSNLPGVSSLPLLISQTDTNGITCISLFAFLCLRKLWKDLQEIKNNGRSKLTDIEKDYSHIQFTYLNHENVLPIH